MHRKKGIIFIAIVAFVVLGVAASKPPTGRNLKVLPKDISDQKLDSFMHVYTKALGEKCSFCHVPFNKNFPDSLDYASDAEPMKEEARKMMLMTMEINKTNFWFDKNTQPLYLKTISCKTCHNGQAIPQE